MILVVSVLLALGGECSGCHATAPVDERGALSSAHLGASWRPLVPPPLAGKARPQDDGIDRATQLCLSCHPLAGETRGQPGHFVRHPVGVRPRLAAWARAALPLFDVTGTPDDPSDDVMGCGTCHLTHASPNPFLLRWGAEEQVAGCGACHAEALGGAVPARRLRAARRAS